MNTREEIQPPSTARVTSIAYSKTCNRFVAGLDTGLHAFRTENCFTTYKPDLPFDGGISIAEALDDRYLAFVCTRKGPCGGPNVFVFWDAVLGRELTRFDLHEPIKGLRLQLRWLAVILQERTMIMQYQELEQPPPPKSDDPASQQTAEIDPNERLFAPNRAHSLIRTAPNPHALACLSNDLLVLSAQTVGQVQLVHLKKEGPSTKRVLRAHNSSIRCMALSPDGSQLATASEQGTLIRVYNSTTLDQVAELRRGMDHAIISSLAFSPGNRWVASTSDKGTLHVFDLRPSSAAQTSSKERQRGKSQSYASHRLSGTGYDKDSMSGMSAGHSSPAPSSAIGTGTGAGYQGSVQEYYGLRPPPVSASPPAREVAVSAMAALKASPFAPRIVKDTRSVASAPFYMGNDDAYWQGGTQYSWTKSPDGTRKRVKNQILPRPNDPSGKPPKGLLAFKSATADSSDDGGATIYAIGGGSDHRWERFQLLPAEGGKWTLVNEGFRRYLTPQFAE